MFDPKTDRFPYPVDTDRHYLEVKKNDGTVFDAKYPYVDRSKGFLFWQAFVRFVLHILVFPLMKIRLGLRVEGRENLKKYRDVIRNGVITCSNHVHMWDYIAILSVMKPKGQYVLSWAPNIRGENGKMIRGVGGIPIPEDNFRATNAYLAAVKKLLQEGRRVQVYAEGSMWEYYRPIRPFKRGVSFLSMTADRPVLPLAFTYREPGWIRKHIFHQIATLTLHVGEPMKADPALEGKDAETEFSVRIHDAVCRLAGIKPEENLYPPVFDRSKRVDYYTTEYGKGYKGSW